jgi:hypothetical protein
MVQEEDPEHPTIHYIDTNVPQYEPLINRLPVGDLAFQKDYVLKDTF